MVGEISSILRELEQVQDRLSALCGDLGAERLDLMARQEELRTRAARLAESVDSDWSTQQLLTQLASLRRRRDVLGRQRSRRGFGPGQQAGPVGDGASQVEQRINLIRELLADRGINVH